MAKGIYLGIDSLSRKVKKMYLGIEGIARKVKKGYIGINGIARLFFAGGGSKPVWQGYAQQFDQRLRSRAASIVGKHLIFFSGHNGVNTTGYVDSYSSDLTKQSLSSIGGYGFGRDNSANPPNANYACFGPGAYTNQTSTQLTQAYDADLTRQDLSNGNDSISNSFPIGLAGYMLFVRGNFGVNGNKWVWGYSSDLEKIPEIPNDSAYYKSSGNIATGALSGKYGIIAGGSWQSDETSDVWLLSPELTLSASPTGMEQKRNNASVASMDKYVLIAGGMVRTSDNPLSNVEAFSEDGTRISCDSLVSGRETPAGITSPYAAVFMGGIGNDDERSNAIDVYDEDLTHTTELTLKKGRSEIPRAASVLDDLIFVGGGVTGRFYTDVDATVEVYTLE